MPASAPAAAFLLRRPLRRGAGGRSLVLDHRPVRGRALRRLPVRPRRSRHEGRDRGLHRCCGALPRRRGRDFGGSISLLITGDEEGPAVNGTVKMLKSSPSAARRSMPAWSEQYVTGTATISRRIGHAGGCPRHCYSHWFITFTETRRRRGRYYRALASDTADPAGRRGRTGAPQQRPHHDPVGHPNQHGGQRRSTHDSPRNRPDLAHAAAVIQQPAAVPDRVHQRAAPRPARSGGPGRPPAGNPPAAATGFPSPGRSAAR